MSSGTVTIGGPWSLFYRTKTWNGSNGQKETTPTGKVRTKWNWYQMGLVEEKKSYSEMGYLQSLERYGNDRSLFGSEHEFTLKAKLASKIREHEFHAGIAVAEGRKTIALVLDTTRKLALSFRAARRGDYSAAVRHLGAEPRSKKFSSKDLSARVLEIQYGWRPLLSDVKAAAEAFAFHTQSEPKTTIRQGLKYEAPLMGDQYMSFWGFDENKRMVYAQIIAELTQPLSAVRRLGLEDPLSVAWEVMPWSFVFDWFIPIGKYLESLNVLNGVEGRFLISVKMELKLSGVFTEDTFPEFVGARARLRCVNVWRWIGDASMPFPQFKGVKSALSAEHVFNAIALARNRVSGRFTAI